jgi:hypothetical protein
MRYLIDEVNKYFHWYYFEKFTFSFRSWNMQKS